MNTKQAFVVIEIGWEYNDEVYHRGNSDDESGSPTKVFLSKEKAEKAALKANIDELRGMCKGSKEKYSIALNEYGYGRDEVIETDKEEELRSLLSLNKSLIDESAEILCGNCDEPISKKAKFCSNCGHDLTKKENRKFLADLDSWWENGAELPENLSDETLEKILNCLSISWYTVTEVELEE